MKPPENFIGVPDNPNSKTEEIFRGGNYLMSYHGGLDQYGFLLENGGVIELHFQLFSEVPDLDYRTMEGSAEAQEEFSVLENYVKRARSIGVDFMAHMPFIRDQKIEFPERDGYFNFDFEWLVVPEAYSENPMTIPAVVADSIEDKCINVHVAAMTDICRTIDLLDVLGIELLTIHASKPGCFFTGDELDAFEKRLQEIQEYIRSKGNKILMCIETGGLRPEEHLRLCENLGVYINMDPAHFRLDLEQLHPEWSQEEQDRETLAFTRANLAYIKNMHLTQTLEHTDAHLGVYQHGVIGCNGELIRLLYEEKERGNKIFAMVESKPDIENYRYIDKALKPRIVYKGKSKSTVTLLLGHAVSTKSTTKKAIAQPEHQIIASDEIIQVLLNSAIGMGQMYTNRVNEGIRQISYDTITKQVTQLIQDNKDIIVDATFDKQIRRQELFDLLNAHEIENVYIIRSESEDFRREHLDETNSFAIRAFEERKKELKEAKSRGKLPRQFLLHNFEIYQKLIAGYEPFDLKEFPRAHLAEINVEKQTLMMYNEDFRLRHYVFNIVEQRRNKG
ncbi:MAG: hypothetical protein HQL32_17870, partial [Planctomycetes bacterium]|nr:hypothetical protein [Planctomycetota bacterium]